jgi:uncharacterized protein (DUF927 family)
MTNGVWDENRRKHQLEIWEGYVRFRAASRAATKSAKQAKDAGMSDNEEIDRVAEAAGLKAGEEALAEDRRKRKKKANGAASAEPKKRGRRRAPGALTARQIDLEGEDQDADEGADSGAGADFQDVGDDGPGYTVTHKGLFWRDDRGQYTWLSQPFVVLGRCRTPPDVRGRTNDWGLLIRFRNKDGVDRDEIISDESLFADLGVMCGALAGAGMSICPNDKERKLFRNYLVRVPTDDRVTLARTLGWNVVADERAFVLSNGDVISARAPQERVAAVFASGKHEERGTLDQWRDGAGKMAAEHTFGILAVSIAFAGPLLWLGGFESGGFDLYGKSSIGKTTHQRFACSVWGSGADGAYLKTWRTTSNAMEAVLAGASDTLLVLDEIEQVNEAEIGSIVYMITGNIGKQRLRRDTSWREPPQWRALILSSGESPIETKLTEAKGRAKAGHLVRVVDIPAERSPGTAFDRSEGEDGFTAIAFIDAVKRETSTHYGTAGHAFVEALIDHKVDRSGLRERVDAFKRDVIAGAHGQAERVAERLGVVAAAGELAVAFGIAPWPVGAPTKAAKLAFGQWFAKRGGSKPFEERQAIERVKGIIERFGDSRFETTTTDPDRRPVVDRLGFWRGDGENRRWLVLPQAWRDEVCRGLDPEAVAKTLAGLGMLERSKTGRDLAKLVKVRGRVMRFYVITPLILEGGKAGDKEDDDD